MLINLITVEQLLMAVISYNQLQLVILLSFFDIKS